jgi:transcription elongation factor GreA
MKPDFAPGDSPVDDRNDIVMNNDREPMTREDYEKLRAELDHMQNVKMIEVTKRVAAAREMGDLSENAEYHAAREDQGQLQAKIDLLKDKLGRALLVDPTSLSNDSVVFGMKVRVKDLDTDEEEIYQLVGPSSVDYDNNKILATSPIGQGLLGKKPGEVAEIQVPRGMIRYQVLEISVP